MDNNNLISTFRSQWPQLSLDQGLTCQAAASELPDVCRWWRQAGASLVDAFALADPASPQEYLVRYVFEVPGIYSLVSICSRVGGEPPTYPAVSMDLHVADWLEREIFEMYGIVPQGHPALGGFIMHDRGKGGPFPLRKNEAALQQFQAPIPFPPHPVAGRGAFEMPLGPVYAGVAESIHFGLASIGEEVFWVTPHLFFKHRGLEKTGELLPLTSLVQLVRRLSGIGAVAESLALCQALETCAGTEAPPAALFLRSLLAELERLYNHIGNLADICESTSLSVGAAQGFMLRERLLRLNCLLSGSRYLMNTVCFGGVALDWTLQKTALVRDTLKLLTEDFRRWLKMLLNTDSFLDRLESIGILEAESALNLGATGPVGRASGVDRDWRRDHPYAAYDQVEFRVPMVNDGDGLARLKIRAAEVEESLSMVEQLLAKLPGGPVVNGAPLRLLPGAGATGACEGPRGASLHWVLAGENNRLWRLRLRTSSLMNWHVFPLATEGCAFQDFPIILASFGLSLAESDR